MNPAHVPTVEIESLAEWDARIGSAEAIAGWVVQSVDLSQRAADLNRVDPEGAILLGCELPDGLADDLLERGALIFPRLPHVPFDAYRATLYSPAELYDGIIDGQLYAHTTDAAIYSWAKSLPAPEDLASSLAMTLHDHAVTDALEELMAGIDPARTVGLMGGHALPRGSDDYVGAARLASQLTLSGYTVLTGGGPGAMEAANLGAYLAGEYAVLSNAIDQLSAAPDWQGNQTMWVATALDIRAQTAATGRSIGVPTWFYGHEPSNVFATAIAKYFSNALREDLLLQHCRGGLIYLPGAAGTVQEVFQAATANYYSADPHLVCPMIFVGVDYWTHQLPVWPLVEELGRGRTMGERLLLVDDVDEAVKYLNGRLRG
ncbi:MAG: LOG family protein [Brooklawnia sp.]|uniref:LOG family protein n=1 Tax=Brooklawnia sp. TaxID=2699740 RepID=UPI003C726165